MNQQKNRSGMDISNCPCRQKFDFPPELPHSDHRRDSDWQHFDKISFKTSEYLQHLQFQCCNLRSKNLTFHRNCHIRTIEGILTSNILIKCNILTKLISRHQNIFNISGFDVATWDMSSFINRGFKVKQCNLNVHNLFKI